MQLRSETEALFRDLVNYCRNDKDVVPTGVREDRAPTYRRLVRNIIFSNLEKAYPIANVTLGEEKWNRLTGDFFEQWNIPSPELWRMPYSLLEYVDSTNYAELIAAPYLTDLLLFEWKEIEIYMIEDYQYPELSQIADPLIDELQLNMESEIIEVGYPVHRERGPEFSEVNNRYLLLCYRHPETLSVKFIELAQGAALLVELLRTRPQNGSELFSEISKIATSPNLSKELETTGVKILRELISNRVILGAISR